MNREEPILAGNLGRRGRFRGKEYTMYIGIGTLVAIVVIVLVVRAIL